MTEEGRKRIGEANKKRVWTSESRKKVARAASGRKHTEESKRKIGTANTGKFKSEEVRQKMSKNRSGIPVSEETRLKMSITRRGRKTNKPSPLRGRHHSEETRKRLSIIRSKSMKEWQAAHLNSLIKNPSKPQSALFALVKVLREDAVMNYPCGRYSIDIAVPSLMVAIEYDGSYWHKDLIKDQIRQEALEAKGWKFIRYRDYIPSPKELILHIEERRAA